MGHWPILDNSVQAQFYLWPMSLWGVRDGGPVYCVPCLNVCTVNEHHSPIYLILLYLTNSITSIGSNDVHCLSFSLSLSLSLSLSFHFHIGFTSMGHIRITSIGSASGIGLHPCSLPSTRFDVPSCIDITIALGIGKHNPNNEHHYGTHPHSLSLLNSPLLHGQQSNISLGAPKQQQLNQLYFWANSQLLAVAASTSTPFTHWLCIFLIYSWINSIHAIMHG